jgi:hypothetical protein
MDVFDLLNMSLGPSSVFRVRGCNPRFALARTTYLSKSLGPLVEGI